MFFISWTIFYIFFRSTEEKINILEHWQKEGGVMILSYDMFRTLNNQKNKDDNERISSTLLNPGADLVVCDEGHLIKNDETKINQILSQVRTKRRIILTGTPLQNNLKECKC